MIKRRPEDVSAEECQEIYRSIAFLANCFQAQYTENMPEDEEVNVSSNIDTLADMLRELAPWAELRYGGGRNVWVVEEIERSE